MYNLKLKSKQIKRNSVLPFDDIHSYDEWITEQGNEDVYEANDESDQQPHVNDLATRPSNETNVDGVDGGEYNVIHDAILEHVENMISNAIVEDVILDVIVDEDEASCDGEEEHDDDEDNDGDDIEDVGGFEF
ncbi:hypothetical protein Cni_G09496 [Canna indica]|uniref:Uncharacterized protein n=1 Tax=Canna indica TaxID=4628 RepID=A0AAQ3K2L5_9LILI|nr:hypothetical protein Cni_G09496 [Canna indica]